MSLPSGWKAWGWTISPFVGAWRKWRDVYKRQVLLKGVPGIKTNLLFTIPLLLIMAVVNTLFTHNGKTTLFFINGLRITLEAFCYGLAAAAMLSAIVIWFMSFNIVMSADKLIYLFGKAAPVLGLTLSMVFRFIPLLQARYREISMGQRCMEMCIRDRIQFMKEFEEKNK